MANDQYIVMRVECSPCRTKQKVHVSKSIGGGQMANQTIPCLNCNSYFKVAAPDRIIRGPFPT